MNWIEAVVLALVQGLTEFLPISSSAHLILLPRFLGWQDQGLAFDVAVHLGTLTAVILYFRAEIAAILHAWFESLRNAGAPTDDARLGWAVLLATLPVGLAGLIFREFVEGGLRSPMVIAVATAVFGVLLWVVDRRGGAGKNEYAVSLGIALLIGLAQVLALIPGTSRSGVTITAGLALGLSRQSAARFSFMMAIPVIALAASIELWHLVRNPEPVQWGMIGLGIGVAAVSAYVSIRVLLSALTRVSMLPFAVYRLILAAVIVLAFA